jgi:hypothetical protein
MIILLSKGKDSGHLEATFVFDGTSDRYPLAIVLGTLMAAYKTLPPDLHVRNNPKVPNQCMLSVDVKRKQEIELYEQILNVLHKQVLLDIEPAGLKQYNADKLPDFPIIANHQYGRCGDADGRKLRHFRKTFTNLNVHGLARISLEQVVLDSDIPLGEIVWNGKKKSFEHATTGSAQTVTMTAKPKLNPLRFSASESAQRWEAAKASIPSPQATVAGQSKMRGDESDGDARSEGSTLATDTSERDGEESFSDNSDSGRSDRSAGSRKKISATTAVGEGADESRQQLRSKADDLLAELDELVTQPTPVTAPVATETKRSVLRTTLNDDYVQQLISEQEATSRMSGAGLADAPLTVASNPSPDEEIFLSIPINSPVNNDVVAWAEAVMEYESSHPVTEEQINREQRKIREIDQYSQAIKADRHEQLSLLNGFSAGEFERLVWALATVEWKQTHPAEVEQEELIEKQRRAAIKQIKDRKCQPQNDNAALERSAAERTRQPQAAAGPVNPDALVANLQQPAAQISTPRSKVWPGIGCGFGVFSAVGGIAGGATLGALIFMSILAPPLGLIIGVSAACGFLLLLGIALTIKFSYDLYQISKENKQRTVITPVVSHTSHAQSPSTNLSQHSAPATAPTLTSSTSAPAAQEADQPIQFRGFVSRHDSLTHQPPLPPTARPASQPSIRLG